jgi:hypothetical protein
MEPGRLSIALTWKQFGLLLLATASPVDPLATVAQLDTLVARRGSPGSSSVTEQESPPPSVEIPALPRRHRCRVLRFHRLSLNRSGLREAGCDVRLALSRAFLIQPFPHSHENPAARRCST